jgi:hypothetical protein
MPHDKIAKMAGVHAHSMKSPMDHSPHHEAVCAGMSDAEMRQFMREEQAEGMHPSLKGKRF